MTQAIDQVQAAEETRPKPLIGSRQHDDQRSQTSSLDITRDTKRPRPHVHRGTNGKRTTQEIFDALYTALENANGDRLSVSKLAEKTEMAYETWYWSMRLAEQISQDWPLEVQAFRRKRYYSFRRRTRRSRRASNGSKMRALTEKEK